MFFYLIIKRENEVVISTNPMLIPALFVRYVKLFQLQVQLLKFLE